MPNWTSNRINVEGEPSDIREFLEAVKWEDQLFDFNRIISMPELLKHTGTGARDIDGQPVTSWYVVKSWNADFPGQKERVRLFTPQEQEELTAIGHKNWYNWTIAEWGTKWNACHVQIDEGEGYAEITFNTAWSAPVPVLRKMVEMFPTLAFDCRWRHDDESPYPHSLDDEPDDEVLPLATRIAGGIHA